MADLPGLPAYRLVAGAPHYAPAPPLALADLHVCLRCGSLVAYRVAHDEFHERTDRV